MRTVTVEQVLSWSPCSNYTPERLQKLAAGRESLTARDVAELEIPTADRLWVLLRPHWLPERQLHELACDFAEHVVHLCDDPRPAEAIRVKRAWLAGEATDSELAAAWDAAGAAAWAAARGAARAAARGPAWDAARGAAWAAAWDAARAAARDAAWDAARGPALAAARAAAWAAAWDAARAAAWDAAWDAAWAAAWAAAWDAARDAEEEWQLDHLLNVIEAAE